MLAQLRLALDFFVGRRTTGRTRRRQSSCVCAPPLRSVRAPRGVPAGVVARVEMNAAEGPIVPEAASGVPPQPAEGASRGATERPKSPARITQSNALSQYSLTKRDLAALPCRTEANPHSRYGAAMRLYVLADVQAVANTKHGGAAGLAQKRARNEAMAAKAAATRAHNDGWRVGANPAVWTVSAHVDFTMPFKAAVRTFLLCANRRRLFGGADSFAELTQRCIQLMVEVVPPRANQLAKKPRPCLAICAAAQDSDDDSDGSGFGGFF